MTKEEPRKTSLSVKLVCGAVAGVIGTCIIFPLDIIKTRLQNQKPAETTKLKNAAKLADAVKNTKPNVVYTGVLDAGKKIIAKEGFKSLYNGLIPNLVGIIPEKAIKLAVNDYAREYWGSKLKTDPDKIPVRYGVLAGATAGFCQVVATNPMEIVKIQLQLATTKLSATEVVRSMGLRGLYKGTFATLARDVPFSMVFFSLVSVFKDLSTRENEKTPLYAVFGSGILSGAVAAGLVTPMDVVLTKV